MLSGGHDERRNGGIFLSVMMSNGSVYSVPIENS